MFQPSCSADEEPGRTWPIVAPLLLFGSGPRKGARSALKHESSDSICQPIDNA